MNLTYTEFIRNCMKCYLSYNTSNVLKDALHGKVTKYFLYVLHRYRWSHCAKFGCKNKTFNSNEEELGKCNDVTTSRHFTIKNKKYCYKDKFVKSTIICSK